MVNIFLYFSANIGTTLLQALLDLWPKCHPDEGQGKLRAQIDKGYGHLIVQIDKEGLGNLVVQIDKEGHHNMVVQNEKVMVIW